MKNLFIGTALGVIVGIIVSVIFFFNTCWGMYFCKNPCGNPDQCNGIAIMIFTIITIIGFIMGCVTAILIKKK